MFVWSIIKAVVGVVVWVVKAVVIAAAWAAAHPFVAILVGAALYTVAAWAGTQDWFGADVVASLAAGLGYHLVVAALLGFLVKETVGAVAASLVWLSKYVDLWMIGPAATRVFGWLP